MNEVVFISAGLLKPKKKNNKLARLHNYINYGLLGLASILDQRGYAVKLFHGNFKAPDDFCKDLLSKVSIDSSVPIFLSLPSYYAIDWATQFCRLLKEFHPTCKIVVGGRWVVGDDSSWLKNKIPQIDLIVPGLAEDIIEDLLDYKKWSNTLQPIKKSKKIPRLDFSIIDNYLDYQPSIEVSRGCGMGCAFCVEKNVSPSFRSPQNIISDLIYLTDQYNGNISPYFEASLFKPTMDWIREFKSLYNDRLLNTKWRCETRVDAMPVENIELLVKSGLKVVDLGLESASKAQLLLMNKTKNPKKYLDKASELLKQCYNCGILTKVNVLLYPGETLDTINETYEWLNRHRKYIKGLSVGPLVLYRYGVYSQEFFQELQSYGARMLVENSIDDKGYAKLHLSSEIDYDESVSLSEKISRDFMSHRDYFDLKSFSYLPRSFTYEDFLSIISESPSNTFPFNMETIRETI